MDNKLLGGILLIVGTGVGAGTLGLPLAVSIAGFVPGVALLLACWLVMTLGAFLILEINMWFPRGSNLFSMAQGTLGIGGQSIAWIAYLILLYSLISAYGSVGRDVVFAFSEVFMTRHVDEATWLDVLVFFVIFGGFVWIGIKSVDYCTRGLIGVKFLLYLLLVILIFPHVDVNLLAQKEYVSLVSGVTVVLTSFGFAVIIPSLRTYLDNDVRKLRLAILLGSLIPLMLYAAWIAIILGVLPRSGEFNILEIKAAGELGDALQVMLQSNTIATVFWLFTSVAVVTSFLGVALSLTDVLSDGLSIEKQGIGKLVIMLLTFLPPVLMIIFYPELFLLGLSVAGIACVIHQILLPTLMVIRGRYFSDKDTSQYQVLGGNKLVLLVMLIAAIYLLYVGIFHDLALFS